MISTTDKVQQIVKTKYKESTTIISGIRKDPTLVLLTTGSALGRSALYDRITFDGQKLFVRIGESKGWGHFHLNNGLFALLKNYIDGTVPGKSSNRFGNGPNWKIRTMRTALTQLNIPSDLLRHGVKREIYGIPLAYNFSEFLRGENDDIRFKELYFDSLVSYWKDRWLKGRIERKRDFVNFNRNKIPELIRGKQEVDSKE